jgi:hypothetical protein
MDFVLTFGLIIATILPFSVNKKNIAKVFRSV